MTNLSPHSAQTASRQRWSKALGNVLPWLVLLIMLAMGVFMWQGGWSTQVERLRFPETLERPGHESLTSSGRDYFSFYAAGRLVHEGRGDEIYDIEAIHALQEREIGGEVEREDVLPYFNPPFLAAAFAPLTTLPIGHFAIVVFAVVVMAEIAGGIALQRLLGLKSIHERLFFWAWYVSTFSLFWMAVEGQISMFLFFAWLGFYVFQTRGDERLSGAVLALGLVKPHYVLLPLVLLVARRQWRAVGTFAAIAGALVMASILVSGPGVLTDYPRFLIESTAWEDQGIKTRTMFGWNSFVAGITGDHSPSLLLMGPLYLMTLAAVVTAWRGPWEPRAPRFMLQIGVTILASLLISAHLYVQDLCLLTLAIGLGARYSMTTTGYYGAWPWIAVAVWVGQIYGLELQSLVRINIMTPAMAALGVYMLLKLRNQQHTEIAKAEPSAVVLARAA